MKDVILRIWAARYHLLTFLANALVVASAVDAIPPTGNVHKIYMGFILILGIYGFQGALKLPPAGYKIVSVAGPVVLLALFLLASCATGANGARQVVTNFDTFNGAGARVANAAMKQCASDVHDFIAAGKLAEADARQTTCEKLFGPTVIVLKADLDAADATMKAIDVAEKLKTKDYGGILAPLYAAAANVVRIFTDAGLKIPVSIPGVN